ncbi:MAG: aminopeptidase [Candidatus Fermentibacteraceae bacterium]
MSTHDSRREELFQDFIRDTAERARFAETLTGELKRGMTLEKLREVNGYWYAPLGPEAYEGDFSNPDFAAQAFGLSEGQHLSAFRYDAFGLLSASVNHETGVIARFLETLDKLSKVGPAGAVTVIRDYYRLPDRDQLAGMLRRRFDPRENTLGERLETACAGDLSFLFLHGMKVDRAHEEMASFLFGLPESDLRDIGDTLAEAYSLGLSEEGKDSFKNRNVVTVSLPMGGEALFRHIRASFARAGLLAHAAPVHRPPSNRQANYDHRFKYALYLDQNTVDSQIAMRREVFDELSGVLHAYSGVAHVSLFGEQPFSPSPKQSMVRADREMSALYNRFTQLGVALNQSHLPRHETSFSMISFPSPEIGPAFHDIFRDCVKVNTLSNSEYRPVQAAIINAMDGAERVRVLGAPGNDTDITVILHPLSDPGRETAFENCLASVNIPVGEVFTSPVLQGTNGVLHVSEAFLDGLRYTDLRMVFRDGEAVEWSCSNFDDPEKGREYIRENIFYPHESLPLGEFAIGTNTVAYAMGVKHGIMGLLPVLILEKTGPHFAVGDTCYSREEDQDRFDPDSGKRLVAVENERSALRTTDPDRAYTNRHVDITLPYSGLDSISAVHPDGKEVFLMRGGRFVLPGTEMLNLPLEGLGD